MDKRGRNPFRLTADMKLTVILAWISLMASLCAAPKLGVVRFTDIYRGLPSTQAMQKKMQAQRQAFEEYRADEVKRINAEDVIAFLGEKPADGAGEAPEGADAGTQPEPAGQPVEE
jgi:hypothetical protein